MIVQILKWVYAHTSFWEIAVAAIFTLFCVVIYRLDRASDVSFKFNDLFASGDWDGKASISRLGYFGAFLSHSLIVLHREMKDGITTELISFYALIWSGAYVVLKTIEMRTATTQSKGDNDGPQATEPRRDP